MLDPVENLVTVTASTGYDQNAVSIVVLSGGSSLPTSGSFNMTWWNSTDYPNPADDPNVEIVRVNGPAISGNTLPLARAQEGTAASPKNIAGKTYKLILGITAKMISDIASQLVPTALTPSTGNYKTVLTVGFSNADYIVDGTDDQVQVQAAVDAVISAGGGTVRIKSGTYNFSAGVVKSLGGKDLRILGDGLATVINNSATVSSASTSTFAITGSASIGGEFLEISDLSLLGNSTCGMGLRLSQIYQGRLCNIEARNFTAAAGWGIGIWLDQIIDFQVINPVCRGCSYSGMSFTSATNANQIIGGWLDSNTTTGLSITGGSRRNVFLGTIFQSNTTYGVNITGSAEGTSFIACWFENQSIGIQSVATNMVIDQCRFDSTTTADIALATGAANTQIINNHFQSTVGIITLASGVDKIVIKDNSGLNTVTDNGATNSSVTKDGKVGVLTTSPANSLTVNGGLEIKGSSFSGSGNGFWLPNTNQIGFVTAGGTKAYLDLNGFSYGASTVRAPIQGNAGDGAQVMASSTNNNSGAIAGIEFRYNNGATTSHIAQILGLTQSGGGGDLLFQTAPSGSGSYSTIVYMLRNGQVGIGVSPSASAALEIASTTGALLIPRMTTTQKNALTAVNGMLVYDSTLNKFQGFENGAWANLI